MLCDYRCIKCVGPLNTDCSKCRNYFYLWKNNTVCDDICPIGQYIALDHAYPANETECAYCNDTCLTCEGEYRNCSSCKGANYTFTVNTSFLYCYNNSYCECQTTCPTQPVNFLTTIGYYGSYMTMVCYPCPTPCSNCNINIVTTRYPDISCGSDKFCKVGLVCTNCLQDYVVVGGQCIN